MSEQEQGARVVFDPLAVAALGLVTSISRRNLRKGLTYWVQVPRGQVAEVARLLDERYPGAIEAVYDALEGGEKE